MDKPLDPVCHGRRIFETDSGLVGLGPAKMELEDKVVVLLGGPLPYVLRKCDNKEKQNIFIGECYVLGAMAGEALAHLREELEGLGHQLGICGPPICDSKLETFKII